MNNNIRFVSVVLGCLVCVGCAATKPLTIPQTKLTELVQSSPVYLATTDPSSFEDRAKIGSRGLFGAIGATVDVAASSIGGKKLANELNLSDPSIDLKARFHDFLKSKFPTSQIIDQSTPYDRSSIAKSKGVFFVFNTTLQGLFCYPDGCEHARVGYEVHAELYDIETSSVIWAENCKAFGPRAGSAYTKQQLLENSGALLRESLRSAVDLCAGSLLRKLFSDTTGEK